MPAGAPIRTAHRPRWALVALLPLAAAESFLGPPTAQAGGALQLPAGRWVHIASGAAPAVHTTSGDPLAPAAQDSFAIYGGPGSPQGKFQDSAGNGDRQGWVGVDLSALPPVLPYGEFSKLATLLTDLDDCRERGSPALGFVDDGTPPSNYPSQSTGGEVSAAWNYGVGGGYVVSYSGGLGAAGLALHDEVWSPEIAWDVATTTADDGIAGGLTLRYRVWEHLPLHNGIFHTWRVRSFPDPTSGAWSPWRDRGFVYYGGTPSWRVRAVEVGDLLVAAPQKLQVALGVIDLSAALAVPGDDATPSPVFDDVALIKHDVDGPLLTVREIDQFHDGFPRSGWGANAPTLADLALRMDVARDINPGGGTVLSGDSMLVQVTPTLPGAALSGPPVMTWFLRPNPLFDSVRVLPPSVVAVPNGWKGTIAGTPVLGAGGIPVPNLWCFDLPDGPARASRVLSEPDEPPLVFPGDRLWMFVEATDTQGHSTFWLRDPGDHEIPNGELCGTGTAGKRATPTRDEPTPKEPPPDGLPGIWEGGLGMAGGGWMAHAQLGGLPVVQPRILIWDDASAGNDLALMEAALGQLGVLRGRDYDVYTTLAAACGAGNGLGATFAHGASADQLSGYDVILYLGGDGPLLSDGTDQAANEKSDDLALLAAWRSQPAHRSMVYFADDVGAAAVAQGSLTRSYLEQTEAVTLVDDDVAPAVEEQDVVLVTPTGLGSSLLQTTFAVAGGCPTPRRFDHIVPRDGTAAVASHRFRSRAGVPLVGPAASVWHARLQNVGGTNWRRYDVTFPFAFAAIRDDLHESDPGAAVAARARLLGELLAAFGQPTSPGDAVGGPPPVAAVVRVGPAYPNPFNGTATVRVHLERPMPLGARVVDARGRQVCTLLPTTAAVGDVQLVWHGVDAAGTAVASGVYAVEVQAGARRERRRVMLLK